MEPSNRSNTQALEPRVMVADPRIAEKRSLSKRPDDLTLIEHQQVFGIDKNLIITVAVVGVSLCFSLYLFRELKKLKDDVRTIKTQEPDTELAEKVEENSEAVKAIETKLDQLITAISTRERKYQQMMMMQQPQQPQQMMAQQPQQMMAQHPQQMMQQPPQVTEQEYQNQQIMQQQVAQQQQIAQQMMMQQQMEQQQQQQQQHQQMSQPPVMGGRLAGSAVTIEDPGVIRI